MMLDSFDTAALRVENIENSTHLQELGQSFKSGLSEINGAFQKIDTVVDENISAYLHMEQTAVRPEDYSMVTDSIKKMLNGVEQTDGTQTRGLLEINNMRINPAYVKQNTRQQAGFAAEVISTYKDNMAAVLEGSGDSYFRADDLPDQFPRNDQYVDKIRVNANGDITERIQVKFWGKNGAEWLDRMMRLEGEKYLTAGNDVVNKLECPADYYDDIVQAIGERRASCQQQLEQVTAQGKADVADNIQQKLNKLDRIEEMLTSSKVTSSEAVFARNHPRLYAAGIIAKQSHTEGLRSGLAAAGLTLTVSLVSDVSKCLDGEMSPEEAARDIAVDTIAAGGLGYASAFITTAVSATMQESSVQLISKVGGSCLPAAAVSFVVESYDEIVDYAKGEIDGMELAVSLGENAAVIAGSMEGTQVGAVIGSAAGPVGTVVGGLVGGVVGAAVTTEIYQSAIEFGEEHAEAIATQAVEYANNAIDVVSAQAPEMLENVTEAFNDFFSNAGISLGLG